MRRMWFGEKGIILVITIQATSYSRYSRKNQIIPQFFFLQKSDEQTPGFIVIDGQQRITTTMLFITAVR